MNRRIISGLGVGIIFILMLSFVVFTNREPINDELPSKLLVVVTTFPLYDFTLNVAGNIVEIKPLYQLNQDNHEWELDHRSVELVKKSDILIYNSATNDHYVNELIEISGNNELVLIDASDGLDLIKIDGFIDPHVSLDPLNAITQVELIRDALIILDKNNQERYQSKSTEYLIQLKLLHTEISRELENIKMKEFITHHGSFSYFAKRYDLVQHVIDGHSRNHHHDPTARDISNIVNLVKARGIRVIYSDVFGDSKIPQLIAKEIGGKIMTLDPMDGVSDIEFSEGISYLSKMRENLSRLLHGLNVEKLNSENN